VTTLASVGGEPDPTLLEELRMGSWRFGAGEHVAIPLGRVATVDDPRLTDLKTEIVNDELIVIGPSGDYPATAAGSIIYSLTTYEREFGGGQTTMSRVAFIVDLPHRLAICPDAGWYTGHWEDADFPRGAPVFAVEIRDAPEYGDEAERRMAAKRADYFAAGTRVVWDVDPLRENVIRVYRADDPEHATVYRQGEVAEAEPAVPGWRFPVDEMSD
jgi:Uma2 family endonuclease